MKSRLLILLVVVGCVSSLDARVVEEVDEVVIETAASGGQGPVGTESDEESKKQPTAGKVTRRARSSRNTPGEITRKAKKTAGRNSTRAAKRVGHWN